MSKYFPIDFEEKWSKQWVADGLFQHTFDAKDVTDENRKYLLYAFAYPSGSGLHVGHVEPLTALDILARYYRSIGKKVFFPVGWDAFGLPAENYAIKTGIPPVKTTKDAIDTFSRQIKRIGVSYDWGAEIATCHPGYYQWTQWLFLQLYKKKLAYKKSAPVNWCPSCQTVLANEQVVEGKCERCDTDVIQKKMEQWFFKITQYMDELISGLDSVDWPKATKQQQLNWIGKSEGAEIKFQISNSETQIPVFTTAHDTIYGATFLVVAPEHSLVSASKLTDVQEYLKSAQSKTEEERLVNKEKTGVFSGLYAIHPLTEREIPIWIADYVLAQYGTGAIMAVPGNDERDFQFAQKFDLPITYVAQKNDSSNQEFISYSKEIKENPKQFLLINSGEFDGQDFEAGRENIMKKLDDMSVGKREITYKLRDWLISRQRYWGAPIPIVYDPEGNAHMVKEEHLPWMLPTDVDFKPTGESPLKLSKEFNERVEKLYGKGWTPEYDTMDTFVDSSWYYLRFTDPRNTDEFARTEHMKKWMPVDFYMIGPEHIVLHLLYSRFFTKFLRDEGYLSVDEPFAKMRHQGMILGPDHRKMSKSKGNVINPDDVITEYGADTLRMYEMFMGPIDADKPWSVESVQGQYRFLKRVWSLFGSRVIPTSVEGSLDPSTSLRTGSARDDNEALTQLLNKTIKKVGDDIEALKFNTAIAALMEFLNEVDDNLSLDDAKKFLKILSPFAPFMTEEIWRSQLGGKESIHTVSWPMVDESALQKSTVTIPIQINGKVRGSINISVDDPQEQVIQKALTVQKVQQYITDNSYKKAIYVPGKILNFIV
ncbi:leucine--tRNA ligase [Candidatus Roizmanbacteria bacterium CG_4_10_14_0_2_um_filter_39_13]|uniref:Leucine--tRNA ligase n=1 Tax=Candidatus Roizmanbacteria bacterium CG_4_10_14_0_2_um_filter_39_13 TaxID=1974825 RepID=A0A2M7U1L9_9BACT|nr:MAG: leucine--tRNA ligase [Candidatus Roizmanbacteria bacterium CG_4_10_14_0_2_um_filter_39_13]